VAASPATAELLLRGLDDALAAARVQSHEIETRPELRDGVFEVLDLELAEAPGPAPAAPGA